MRTNAWYYDNGVLSGDTYMNHYCRIGTFTARVHVKIMGHGTTLVHLISGEYTTDDETEFPFHAKVEPERSHTSTSVLHT